MTLRALRVPVPLTIAGEILLPDEAAKYVTRVHRLGPGSRLILFDPERAIESEATILTVERGQTRVRLEPLRPASLRPTRRVTLIQAIGKGDKLDAIVRDATELGVTSILPVFGERSVARSVAETRRERLQRIAIEAARQCGRGDVPEIAAPRDLVGAVERYGLMAGVMGFCLDPGATEPMGPRLYDSGGESELVLVVGPEGGLSEGELAACARAGFACVSMGPFILRTETVCAAVLGAILVIAGARA